MTPHRKAAPRIVIEGTRLTFKTDVALALSCHPTLVGKRAYEYHSPVISAEWSGLSPDAWGSSLITFDPLKAPTALETFSTWVRLFELLRFWPWIIDRFHISTAAYQLQHNGLDYDFAEIDRRLAKAGFSLVFLYRSEETFAAARSIRLATSRRPEQYNDLSIFTIRQEIMKRMVFGNCSPGVTTATATA